MERYPAGIGEKGFLQKDVSKGFPEWLERVEVPKKGGTVHHPLVTDTRSLLWLANQNSITPHVWTSRAPNLYQPDICVFDLDPSKTSPDVLRAAALALRDLLDELGLPSWVKTSGSKGFHIVVPLDGKADFGEVARFAHAVGTLLVKRDPEHLTQEFSKADRGGRILVDTGRNGYSATFAAAYAVRAKPGAPVSAPCTWEEVERGEVGPRTFTLRTMAGRIAEVGDLWGRPARLGRAHAPLFLAISAARSRALGRLRARGDGAARRRRERQHRAVWEDGHQPKPGMGKRALRRRGSRAPRGAHACCSSAARIRTMARRRITRRKRTTTPRSWCSSSGKLNDDSLATLLLRKADWHDYDGIVYLLEHGADPNRMTIWRFTALHQAVRRDNDLRIIDAMLDHGADPLLTNGLNGRSAVAIAARRGRGDVLASLERRGVPIELHGVEELIAACAKNDGRQPCQLPDASPISYANSWRREARCSRSLPGRRTRTACGTSSISA